MMMIDMGLPLEARQKVLEQFGLDKPLLEQYRIYMANLLHGELGMSFNYREPVAEVIEEKIVNTLVLMGFSLSLAWGLGVFLGAVLAWYRGSRFEKIAISFALLLRSSPVFWTGMLAVGYLAGKLGWFPVGGMHTPGQEFHGPIDKFVSLDFLHHLILPSLVRVAYTMANPMLVMRSSMLEVMGEDFVEMARAKGLRERAVLFRHAVRNALLPAVTVLTLLIGFAIGGQVLIETVFNWPGMGREIIMAIQRCDYPVAQGIFLMMGAIVATLNMLTDILYGYLDPRVVYD
jgi:peptide/nickel transport system permease protein